MGINNQHNYYNPAQEHQGMNFRRFPKASGIYQIFNVVNSKRYIGYAKNIQLRCKCHRVELRSGKHKNPHLQLAWNLYGEQSFEFCVLEICTIDNLSAREDYWAKKFNTHNREFGYNEKATGQDVYSHSESTKEKIGRGNKGKQYFGEKNPFFGRHHSKETIDKINENRDSHQMALNAWKTKKEKGYIVSEETRSKLRAVVKSRDFTTGKKVINSDTGDIFNSIKAAAKVAGISEYALGNRLKGVTKNNTPFKYLNNHGL